MRNEYRRGRPCKRCNKYGIWTSFGFVEWRSIIAAVAFSIGMCAVIHVLCLIVAHWRFGW